MTAAWTHALHKARLDAYQCPSCGKPLQTGYGFAGGGMGAYTYCGNSRCLDPYFIKYLDPEMDEHTVDVPEDAGINATMKPRSSS